MSRVVLGVDAELVAPREHLDGERLVQLEEVDVVESQARLRERSLGRGHWPDAHQLGLDAGVREGDEAKSRLEPELRHGVAGREQRGRGAVRQAGRVAGGDAAAGPERRWQAGERLERRLRPEKLVAVCHRPTAVREHGHRHDRLGHHAVLPGRRCALLGAEREAVGVVARQRGEAIVEVLRRLAHDGGALVDDPLGQVAGIEVDLGAHHVVAHVLDAARDHEVGGAHRDLARPGRDRRQRAGAHAVDREARDRVSGARRAARRRARGSVPGRPPARWRP